MFAAAAAAASARGRRGKGLHTSTGNHGSSSVGLRPYVSELTEEEEREKWAEPLEKERLLKTHPTMNMIEERTRAVVNSQIATFVADERKRINNFTEAELKLIKKIYTPVTPFLNRLKKGTQRLVSARTGNNSKNELLQFALDRHLPWQISQMRATLTSEIRKEEVLKLTQEEKKVYDAEKEYQEYEEAGYIRVGTAPGSTTYEWISPEELASRMSNYGTGGKRRFLSRRSKCQTRRRGRK